MTLLAYAIHMAIMEMSTRAATAEPATATATAGTED